jgi:hypothetical protein
MWAVTVQIALALADCSRLLAQPQRSLGHRELFESSAHKVDQCQLTEVDVNMHQKLVE